MTKAELDFDQRIYFMGERLADLSLLELPDGLGAVEIPDALAQTLRADLHGAVEALDQLTAAITASGAGPAEAGRTDYAARLRKLAGLHERAADIGRFARTLG